MFDWHIASSKRRGTGTAVLLAALLAACGGGSAATAGPNATGAATGQPAATQGGGGPAAGACALVPASALEAALGSPVGPAQAGQKSGTGASYCRYTATGSQDYIEFQYQTGVDRASWDADVAKVGMTKGTAISNVGDAAWLEVTSGGARIASVADGVAIWVTIRKPGLVAAIIQPVLEALARTVLEAAKG